MKNFIAISLLLVILVLNQNITNSKTITYSNYPNNIEQNIETSSEYNKDLSEVEKYLFGKTYQKEAIVLRLNRIEQNLFNKNFSSLSTTNRMNNIMTNYKNYYHQNYLSNYYDNSTPINKLKNRFIGYPTGFTPQMNYIPNMQTQGITRSIQSNKGYLFNNSMPINTGMGLHILD